MWHNNVTVHWSTYCRITTTMRWSLKSNFPKTQIKIATITFTLFWKKRCPKSFPIASLEKVNTTCMYVPKVNPTSVVYGVSLLVTVSAGHELETDINIKYLYLPISGHALPVSRPHYQLHTPSPAAPHHRHKTRQLVCCCRCWGQPWLLSKHRLLEPKSETKSGTSVRLLSFFPFFIDIRNIAQREDHEGPGTPPLTRHTAVFSKEAGHGRPLGGKWRGPWYGLEMETPYSLWMTISTCPPASPNQHHRQRKLKYHQNWHHSSLESKYI